MQVGLALVELYDELSVEKLRALVEENKQDPFEHGVHPGPGVSEAGSHASNVLRSLFRSEKK